jgi:hypothetical protein
MFNVKGDTKIYSYRCENLKFYLKVKVVSLSLIGKPRDLLNIVLFKKMYIIFLKLNVKYFDQKDTCFFMQFILKLSSIHPK